METCLFNESDIPGTRKLKTHNLRRIVLFGLEAGVTSSGRDFGTSKIVIPALHLCRSGVLVFVWWGFLIVSKLQDFNRSLEGLRDFKKWGF